MFDEINSIPQWRVKMDLDALENLRRQGKLPPSPPPFSFFRFFRNLWRVITLAHTP